MKCPHCSKPTSKIGKKCVHCGKDIHTPASRPRAVPVRCPLCGHSTRIIDLAGLDLDFCYSCGGIWFDKGEIHQFREAASDPHRCSEMAAALQDLSPTRGRQTPRNDYLNCPVCSLPMSHKQFLEVSRIIMDQCPDHGTWIEKDDLDRILSLIQTGAIEALIAKAAKTSYRKLAERLSKLESQQSNLKMELARARAFSKTHFILDFLGFT